MKGIAMDRSGFWPSARNALVGFALLSSIGAAQQPEVLVELGRPRIFEGESVRYVVTLNQCEDSARPIMPALPGFQVQQGGVSIMRQTLFDGLKRSSIGGPRCEYILTPPGAGDWNIPGPSVVVDGKTYRGPALKLQVIPPNEQDLVVLDASASRTTVYPTQPFSVRLVVAIRSLPEPYRDEDPLRGTGEIPALVIPWADDDALPAGVKPDSPALRWLQGMIPPSRRQVGFGINNVRLGANALFSLFTEQQRAMFRPEPRRVQRKNRAGQTFEYWEYLFERSLTAAKVGPFRLGPVTLKGTFANRANPSGGVDVEEIYAVARPVVVEVREVPVAGRPDSYIGVVGRFQVDAELSPTEVKVGDPMTLSLRVHGQDALDHASAPRLDQVPTLAERFKVYEATEQSGSGERKFTYNLRPLTAGLEQFPPIELAYFDYEKEQYVTLRTDPIPIHVADADRVAEKDIAVAAARSATAPVAVEASRDGIFANITDPREIYDERVRPDSWFLSLGGMVGIFVICSVIAKQIQRRRDDPAFQRRRNAARRASAILQRARQRLAGGARRDALDKLSAAFVGLVADAVDCSEAGLTPRDAAQRLAAHQVDPELVSRCQQLLEELDAGRYGHTPHSLEQQMESAEALLTDLLRELRQRKLAA